MKRLIQCLFLVWMPAWVMAGERSEVIRQAVEQGVLPGFTRLAEQSAWMAFAARQSCDHPDFRIGYFRTFETWSELSHLRFGPSEEDNRAFALTFWPDPRGKTPKALRKLLVADDSDMMTPERFREISIAARGFHALDILLFDANLQDIGTPERRCALVQAIANDIAYTTQELQAGWTGFAPDMITPDAAKVFRNDEEVLRALFNAVTTGLQFSADLRLGRPLGTFDNPRPRRAEAWRSGQSLALLRAAVRGSGTLAVLLAMEDEALALKLADALEAFQTRATALEDPAFAGVATPQGRIRVEALLGDLNRLRRIVREELGPHLGVSAGFNALDGD